MPFSKERALFWWNVFVGVLSVVSLLFFAWIQTAESPHMIDWLGNLAGASFLLLFGPLPTLFYRVQRRWTEERTIRAAITIVLCVLYPVVVMGVLETIDIISG